MSAKLIAEDGLLKGLVLSLRDGDQWVIGRDPDECQLLVEDPETSRKHAICRKTPEGIILENLSLTNPTLINKQELKGTHLLHDGDAVKIGSEVFRFHQETDSLPSETNESPVINGAPDVMKQMKEIEKDFIANDSVVEEEMEKEDPQEDLDQHKNSESSTPEEVSSENKVEPESVPEAAVGQSEVKEETPKAPESAEPVAVPVEAKPEETAPTEAEAPVEAKPEESPGEAKTEQPTEQVAESEETEPEVFSEPEVVSEAKTEQPTEPVAESEETEPEVFSEPEVVSEAKSEEPATPAEEAHEEISKEEPEVISAEQNKDQPENVEPTPAETQAESPPSTVETPMTVTSPSSEKIEEKIDNEEAHPFPEDETPDDTIFEEESSSSPLAEIDFDLKETGRWMLKVVGGANNGAEFALQPNNSYTIGTDPNACDIVFYDTSVSRTHARISIDEQDHLFIEDLKSRNGTLVDGDTLQGKKPLETNVLVTMGTTSFVVLDREGEMHTIISPLLPSIVKVLQKEEEAKAPEAPVENVAAASPPVDLAPQPLIPEVKEDRSANLNAFILISIITGLFVLAGLGISTLFQSKPVVSEQIVDTDKKIDDALMMFPGVKHSFNKSTGRLLLVGHVMTAVDRNQLLYNLQGLPFIKSLDDSGIVIDEYVWKEINQVLNKNPLWKGVTVHSPTAGHFVLSGYLQTRKQGEQLSDYLSSNFPYLDLLEKRVIIEEDVVSNTSIQLQNIGLRDVKVDMKEGQLILSGTVDPKKLGAYDKLVEGLAKIPGVRNIQNLVAQRAPASAIEDISSRYQVGGFSSQGSRFSVVINGRILQNKDPLDGMIITEIKPHTIFLEKDGKKFKIDY